MEESTTATESVADLSNRYVEIRNEREAKREIFEEKDKVYSDQLAEIEAKLIDIMLAENTTSMSTEKYQHPDEYPEGLNVDSRYAVTVKRKPSL